MRNSEKNKINSRHSLTKKITTYIKLVICLLAITTLPQNLYAAQLDSKGTDFWLMFNSNYETSELTLFITGDTATSGTVSIPGLAFTSLFTVTPGTITSVIIPSSAQVTTSDLIGNLGIHVVSAAEVTVYGLNRVQFSTDAFLGLPTDILRTEYINLGYKNTDILNASQFGIVATQNSTAVTITLPVTTGSRTAGVPYLITLNQGQTYQLINTNSAPADLTGSIIQSDKPIAVFGGHQCANIPNGSTIACDHIVEQLTPTNTWGQAFLTVPLATRINGDTFRILASQNGTEVRINGSLVVTLNRGQFYEQIIVGQSEINATNPVLVAQYSNGTSFDGITSDPFQTLIPPKEQFLASYTVTTPASGFPINFINIVAPNAIVGTINLDGSAIPSVSFLPIGSSGFSGAKIPVLIGSHNLDATLPFGITNYGFADFDSYGYPGGLALGQVASLASLVISPKTATNPINTQHCVIGTTKDQNSNPLAGIRVDFAVTGTNTIGGFKFSDALGKAEFCYTGNTAGTDSITASVGNLSDTAAKIWTNVQVPRCDVNGDSFINKTDINLIMAAKNTPASSPTDPKDADGNFIINANDARQCTLKCTNTLCQ
ncbi:IgGFc_binding domain-containing protein [Candidatus Nitrotoga sp. HW29]|uniref:Ig-like domain-containing protein n=1 Tax=Candidatus Nitrotoga sp. HW29 TaxID=2886963 RepID=UPI001EF1FD68|nr:Ig-like domain-containing protein [Candidatus Nitrotoga sp. HW29]CAH1904467.1 IgGFc_binding domain-containing protein [Candidatus Nitrotoga sp. HW29]